MYVDPEVILPEWLCFNQGSFPSTFQNKTNLRAIYLKGIGGDVSFKSADKFQYDALKFLVDNKSTTTGITVTVHATTYSYLDGSGTPTEQVGGTTAEWQALKTAGEAKGITWASGT